MHSCPVCKKELVKKQSDFGIFWACENCQNWLLTLVTLRRTVEPSFFNNLWRELRASDKAGSAPCPLCSNPMNRLVKEDPSDPLVYQACQACGVLWMGPRERSSLPLQAAPEPVKPPPEPPKDELPPEAQELMALHKVELLSERARRENMFDASHLPLWQKALAAAGFPVEDDPDAQYSFPWFTAAITLITTAASIHFFRDYNSSADAYGFIPAMFDRNNWTTFFSCFFVHGGWLHLIGNMYFLFVFGRCVENKIGSLGIFSLLLFSIIGADLFTLFFRPHLGNSSHRSQRRRGRHPAFLRVCLPQKTPGVQHFRIRFCGHSPGAFSRAGGAGSLGDGSNLRVFF